MMTMDEFGKFIHTKRKELNLTQDSFASRLGITPQAVSKWENGIGYPDIALLPEIAKVLNVSLDELFGKDDNTPDFPMTNNGLPRVSILGHRACYSDKELSSQDDHKLHFSDGSEADLLEGSVINLGKGEVCFYETDPTERRYDDSKAETFNRELDPFFSISAIINGCYDLEVIRSEDGVFRLWAQGVPSFIASLEFGVSDGKFTLSNKQMNGNSRGKKSVRLYVGFDLGDELDLTVNGSGDCSVEPDFKKSVVAINGSGCISAKNCGKVSATVNGSGDMNFCACDDVEFCVNGSGDIDAASAANSKVRISGSGDVNLGKVAGDSAITIHGSGDVTLSGVSDKFSCNIDGSGSINGAGLTVGEAEIRTAGAAEIALGRICRRSYEKLSKNTRLTVGSRG